MIETDDPIATLERELMRVAATGDEPARRPRRPRRRLALPLAAALAGAAVTLVITLGGGPDTPGPSLVAAAYAKLAPPADGILVLELDVRQRIGARAAHSRTTQWYARSAVRVRSAVRSARGGQLIAINDSAYRRDLAERYASNANTITTIRHCPNTTVRAVSLDQADPVASLRRQLARRELRPQGTTTFDGRRVQRLVHTIGIADPVRHGTPPARPMSEILVDPATGEPVASIQRPFDGSRTGQALVVTRFVSRRVLPRTAANLALLKLPPHPGARRQTTYVGTCAAARRDATGGRQPRRP